MSLASFDRDTLVSRIRSLRLVAFDFDGVFTDNSVYVFQDGREAVRCSRADGIGLRKLEQVGIEPIIVSTETNPVVVARSEKLKIFCRNGCENKLAVLDELLAERGVGFHETGFVGNDINDLACLEKVGMPMVVRDAHPDVLDIAVYRTDLPGGHGAVREICDLIARVREAHR